MSAAWPEAFREGVRRFNAGDYFEAHEAFEECLDEVENDDRWELCLGLIQIAVGYHKAVSGHPGAERMLGLGLEKLSPFAADAHGVAIEALRSRVRHDLEQGAIPSTDAGVPHLDVEDDHRG